MITISKIQNTVFFNSSIHGVPVGYFKTSLKKRKVGDLRTALVEGIKRATILESKIPLKGEYAKVLAEIKTLVYSPRRDYTRSVDSVVHPMVEVSEITTLGQAWDLHFLGSGHSSLTGKYLKVFTCKEKLRKCAVLLADLLRDV